MRNARNKRPPTKHNRDTLEILREVLRDPLLTSEMEEAACLRPQQVPDFLAKAGTTRTWNRGCPFALETFHGRLLDFEAVAEAAEAVLGAGVSSAQGAVAPNGKPQLLVCVKNALDGYDRSHGCGAERRLPVMFWFDRSRRFGDLVPRSAVYHIGLAALLDVDVRVHRHGVAVNVEDRMDVEILLETAEEQCKRRSRGPRSLFAISYLTVAEDWDEAVPCLRRVMQSTAEQSSLWQILPRTDAARWGWWQWPRLSRCLVQWAGAGPHEPADVLGHRSVPALLLHRAAARAPDERPPCRQGTPGRIGFDGHRVRLSREQVMEMVLRNLALRIKDRDEEILKRFEQASAVSNTQDRAAGVLLPLPRPRVLFPFVDRCAFEDHAVGTRLVVSMAKARGARVEQDAELYAGEKGRNQTSALLRAAADSLDGEVRGLGHTQSFRLPSAEDDSPEAAVDRSITKGVRLVHFGCFEQAQEQLDEARLGLEQRHFAAEEELPRRVVLPTPSQEVRESLTLAACLASSLLQQKKGRHDLVKELKGECMQSLHRLEATTSKRPKPVACWHNLPLLLRVLPSSKRRPSPVAQGGRGDLDWSGMDSTGALDSDVLEDLSVPDPGLERRLCARSRHLMSYLMPLTGERFGADALEVHRIEAGLAKALC
eukprot:s2166_g7.t1